MNHIFLVLADFLKGKSIYAPIRRIIDLIFIISISSLIFEKVYGKYNWLNYNDYKGILNFFIKGNFFIPFSIFIVVGVLTYIIPIAIFSVKTQKKSSKWTNKIISYQLTKETIDNELPELNKASEYLSTPQFSRPLLISFIKELKKQIPNDIFQKIQEGCNKGQRNIESNFLTAFRCLVAITIYFSSLEQFGVVLYMTVLIAIVFFMYLLMLAYSLLDITPVLVGRFKIEVEKFILENSEEKTSK